MRRRKHSRLKLLREREVNIGYGKSEKIAGKRSRRDLSLSSGRGNQTRGLYRREGSDRGSERYLVGESAISEGRSEGRLGSGVI